MNFSGNHLPTTLWNADTLHLPSKLSLAHRDFLVDNGWLASYAPTVAGGIGGQSSLEAQEHVTNRFLNSAARMQFVCSDPKDEEIQVRQMIFDQLADGNIFLLDLAAGNGAGTLALLSLICELRSTAIIPQLPINVSINAVDYSVDALRYYADILDKLEPWLASSAIDVRLTLHHCDLSIAGDFGEVLEGFFQDAEANGTRRFLCVVSALSGAKKDGIAHLLDSLKLAAAALSHSKRNSSWLWVEPHVGKTWLTKAIDTVKLTLEKVAHVFSSKGESFEIVTSGLMLEEKPKRTFKWLDPINGSTTMSGVFVANFKND